MEEATVARDYTWPVKISTFDAGQDQRLPPAGQLRLQQEIGELHMRTGGLGYQVLCDAGMAFLLTRTNSVRPQRGGGPAHLAPGHPRRPVLPLL